MNQVAIPKGEYYTKLVEYYYEYVHWDEFPTPSIYEWAKREFGAVTSLYSNEIMFEREKDATVFLLRWS